MTEYIKCENKVEAENYVLENIMSKFLDTVRFEENMISFKSQYPWIHPGNEICYMHTETIYVSF